MYKLNSRKKRVRTEDAQLEDFYTYKNVYTKHIAEATDVNQGVGGMDEKLVAEFQLGVLTSNGLKPNHSVYEIGAGTGRILEALYPFLTESGARYVGIEIVPELVVLANKRITSFKKSDISFKVIETEDHETYKPDFKPDFIFAFSVFTHMEAEDIVIKLQQLKEISKPNTIGIFTFLPLEHAFGRSCFLYELNFDTSARYKRVRNISFTFDMAKQLAELGGWSVIDTQWAELEAPYADGVARTNQSWLVLKPNISF
jgi:SAM-dependent methyltransferase